MTNKKTNASLIFVIMFAFFVSIILYYNLPDQVATHWNAEGVADGFMSRFSGAYMLPFIMLGLFIVYYFIPKIDPNKTNINSFRPSYNKFWLILFAFFLYVHILSLLWNIGMQFNFAYAIIPAVAALWYTIGTLMKNAKRNFFVGIRTPWTLSSDIVWDKTHKLGGTLFKWAALISLLGLFFQNGLWFAVVPVIVVAIITVVYSYLEYRKLQQPEVVK